MSAGADEDENQFIVLDLIDQKPVRFDMAFARADIIACQGVVAILRRQRYSRGELINDSS